MALAGSAPGLTTFLKPQSSFAQVQSDSSYLLRTLPSFLLLLTLLLNARTPPFFPFSLRRLKIEIEDWIYEANTVEVNIDGGVTLTMLVYSLV